MANSVFGRQGPEISTEEREARRQMHDESAPKQDPFCTPIYILSCHSTKALLVEHFNFLGFGRVETRKFLFAGPFREPATILA